MIMKDKKPSSIYIYGKHAVSETLMARPGLVRGIYVVGSVKHIGFEDLRDLAQNAKISINAVSEKFIEQKVGKGARHQSVVAELSSFPYTYIDEWIGTLDMNDMPACLLLDEVKDVHNVGAMIRTAAAAGMKGVLLPEHRQAPVTSTVFHTSAGTVLSIPIVRVGNVNQALEKLKKSGFWSYGLAMEGEKDLFEYEHDSPAVFVVGSEGKGLRPATEALCDFRVSIPMNEQVESLNASVSGALMMYEYMRKRK